MYIRVIYMITIQIKKNAIFRQVQSTNSRVVKNCTIMSGMFPKTHYVMKMMDLTAMESGVMVLEKTIA